MRYDETMLKIAGDHCPSNKSGLAAMDIQDGLPQHPFLMTSPLLLSSHSVQQFSLQGRSP